MLEGHKIAHGDPLALPPMCKHEDGHFQCSFNRIPDRLHFVKRPLSGDCRDLASLNTVQLILSALCGGEAASPARAQAQADTEGAAPQRVPSPKPVSRASL